MDASTYSRRNLTSTDTVFALLEALARNLDMTLVLPPIVCRYPFANDELGTFCDNIELELEPFGGREQETEGLLEIRAQRPAVLDRSHDGAEVVVHEHDIGEIPRHLGAALAVSGRRMRCV